MQQARKHFEMLAIKAVLHLDWHKHTASHLPHLYTSTPRIQFSIIWDPCAVKVIHLFTCTVHLGYGLYVKAAIEQLNFTGTFITMLLYDHSMILCHYLSHCSCTLYQIILPYFSGHSILSKLGGVHTFFFFHAVRHRDVWGGTTSCDVIIAQD